MAQVAKTAAPTSVTAAPVYARASGMPRNVASIGGGPVESLNPSLGTYLDGAEPFFQSYQSYQPPFDGNGGGYPEDRMMRGGSRTRPFQVQLSSPQVNTASNPVFATMLESFQVGRTDMRVIPASFPSHFKGPVGQAVRQYEMNARVVAGTENVRGGSINVRL